MTHQVHANYGGLFDPVRKTVFPAYYAFRAFDLLYRLKNQAACSAPDGKDVIALAAVSGDGGNGAVLVTNMNPEPVSVSFTLTPSEGRRLAARGMPCDGRRAHLCGNGGVPV